MRIERRTGRGCDSPRLHQKEIFMTFSEILLGDQDEEPSSKKSIGGDV